MNNPTKVDSLRSSVGRPIRPFNQTLDNMYLKRAQALHAKGVVVFTSLGILMALGLLIFGVPITSLDLGIFFGWFFITSMGASIGYHRLFTHRSFKTTRAIWIMFAILGSMTAQGPIIFWVSLHRRHHQCSDKEGDPHSPHVTDKGAKHKSYVRGLWHSYIGWTFVHEVPNATYYARDLLRDKDISRISQQYFGWVIVGLLIPAFLGGVLQRSWIGAFSGFVWGGLIRILLWHNMTWYITSLAHVVGRHEFKSEDCSTNNFWMALPTLGESWHNNHHAFPSAAIVGLKWWQIDICGWVIRILEFLGLAWDVEKPTASMIEAKKLITSSSKQTY